MSYPATSKRNQYLSQPLPRKGTETLLVLSHALGISRDLSQPLPRKGTETKYSLLGRTERESFRNHYPARRRKPSCVATSFHVPGWTFATITPQGDGNITTTGIFSRLLAAVAIGLLHGGLGFTDSAKTADRLHLGHRCRI